LTKVTLTGELSLGLQGVAMSYFSILEGCCNNMNCKRSKVFCAYFEGYTLWKVMLCNAGGVLLACLKSTVK